MRYIQTLQEFMLERDFVGVRQRGYDAFTDGTLLIRFFWWSNAVAARRLGVPRASLVVRIAGHADEHISLVQWPTPTQPPRPWAAVAADLDTYLKTITGES